MQVEFCKSMANVVDLEFRILHHSFNEIIIQPLREMHRQLISIVASKIMPLNGHILTLSLPELNVMLYIQTCSVFQMLSYFLNDSHVVTTHQLL